MSARTAAVTALLVLVLGGVALVGYQRSGPAPVRPIDPVGLDPLVQQLIDDEVAHVDRWRRSVGAWLRLGMAYEANSLYAEAAQSYEQLLALRAGDAKGLHRLACVQERLGDLALATTTMDRAAKAEPTYVGSWLRLSAWQVDLGELQAAAEALRRARALAPAESAVHFGKVRLDLARKLPLEAIATLEQERLLVGPDSAYAHHLLASARRQTGDLDGAREAHAMSGGRRLAFSDPWAIDLQQLQTGYASMRIRAGRLVMAGRYAEAEPRLEEIIAYDPADLRSLNMLGVCRLQQGEMSGALALFARVLEQEPQHYAATVNHARVLIRQRARDTAVLRDAYDRLQSALAARPTDGDGWRVLAGIAELGERPAQMIDALDRAMALDPVATDIRLKAAYAAVAIGRFEDALVRFRTLQEDHPELDEAWLGEVTALVYEGVADVARAALEVSARRRGIDPQRLQMLRDAIGQMR